LNIGFALYIETKIAAKPEQALLRIAVNGTSSYSSSETIESRASNLPTTPPNSNASASEPETKRSEARQRFLKSWTRRKLVEAKRSDLKSATSADVTFALVLNKNLLIFIYFITISCEKYVIS